MDEVPERLAGRAATEAGAIDISDLDLAALAGLPQNALVAALRRVADEYDSGADCDGKFTDGPSAG